MTNWLGLSKQMHCVKSVEIGVIGGPYFSVFELNTDTYGVNLCIQSEYRKMRITNNSVFGHFSGSDGLKVFSSS